MATACSTSGILGEISLVVLQGTSLCNLNCSYCYLSQKSRRDNSNLPLTALGPIFRKILASRFVGNFLQVSWHSGEPLVLSPAYYRAAVDSILSVRDELASHVDVRFDIQTNGTLINEDWCRFFAEYSEVLDVGVSCDGPAHLHNTHRLNWAGQTTHAQVVWGMNLLRTHDIPFDVIAVISPEGLKSARELIEFFAAYHGSIREFHFNLHDEFGQRACDPNWLERYRSMYESFLRDLLDACSSVANSPRIRNFSTFYKMALGAPSFERYDARTMSAPFRSINVQHNGDVTTFYAGLTSNECPNLYGDGNGLVVGNLNSQTLEEIAQSPKLARIWNDFEVSHSACEASCSYYGLCSGGYNLLKVKQYGTFCASVTPECSIHVKTFADVLLEHLAKGASGSAVRPM